MNNKIHSILLYLLFSYCTMDYYRVPEYSRKEIVMTINVTQSQMSYVINKIDIDICKDIANHQEAFDRVMTRILDDVLTNMVKDSKFNILQQNANDDIAKFRMALESWWTLSKIDALIIDHFLFWGEFDTKQHQAWLADIFGKKVDDFFMMDLRSTISEVLYAMLYI